MIPVRVQFSAENLKHLNNHNHASDATESGNVNFEGETEVIAEEKLLFCKALMNQNGESTWC